MTLGDQERYKEYEFEKEIKTLKAQIEQMKNCEKCGKQAVHIMPFTNPPHFFRDECVPFKAEKKQTESEAKTDF